MAAISSFPGSLSQYLNSSWVVFQNPFFGLFSYLSGRTWSGGRAGFRLICSSARSARSAPALSQRHLLRRPPPPPEEGNLPIHWVYGLQARKQKQKAGMKPTRNERMKSLCLFSSSVLCFGTCNNKHRFSLREENKV